MSSLFGIELSVALLAACRVAPLALTAPVFGVLPVSLRLSLAMAWSLAIAGFLAPAQLVPPEAGWGWLVARELSLGATLAIAAQWPLWALLESSRLSARTLFDEPAARALVRATLLAAAALFAELGGLRAVTRGLVATYEVVPLASAGQLSAEPALSAWLRLIAEIISSGLWLSLPLLLAVLVVELTLGVLARAPLLGPLSPRRSALRLGLVWLLWIAVLPEMLAWIVPQLRAAAEGLAELIKGVSR